LLVVDCWLWLLVVALHADLDAVVQSCRDAVVP